MATMGGQIIDGDSGAAPFSRPLLRGYSHALATVAAAYATALLLRLTSADGPKCLSMCVYGASTVLLFLCSALYHLGSWSSHARALVRRMDHATIFVVIAGTYTPIVYNVLTGWWRTSMLVMLWGLALCGVMVMLTGVYVSRTLRVALYMTLGWSALLILPEIVQALGMGALILPIIGAMFYTGGALAYAFRRPRLWPRVFGYHELFHLAIIVASAALFLFIVQDVVPFARR